MEITTVIGLLVNLVVAVFIALLRGAMRRIADDLDKRLAAQDGRLNGHDAKFEQIRLDLAAEREARHAEERTATDRLWQVNSDLKENYPSRRETMKQFGTLVQGLGNLARELGERLDRRHDELNQRHDTLARKLDGMPCRTPACPRPPGTGESQ